MDILLDTNALIWALGDSRRLGRAQATVADRRNRVHVSAASAWEIAIKVGLGKLAVPPDLATWLPAELATLQFTALPIDLGHALEVERLPRHHTDPFDRLLIAQARVEDMVIVTGDRQFERYDVRILQC